MKVKQTEMDKLEKGEDEEVKKSPLVCSYRLLLAGIGFFMFFHLYAQRIGMSVAIVCMVNQTALLELEAKSVPVPSANYTVSIDESLPVCARKVPASANDTKAVHDGPFVWEKSVQGHVLGSFFYGYLISQIPGGLMAEQFGGKWVLVGSLGLSTLGTLLTPVAAKLHFVLLILVRVIVGIGSGALYPAMHAMWGQWAPPLERSKLCGLTYAGAMMGNVIALPLSGVLCQFGFSQGWDSIFYVIGISSTLCIVLWSFLTSNTPATHPRISDQEKNYILGSLKAEGGGTQGKTNWCAVPWKEFFTSGPVWALIIANFCTDWGLYTFLTNIPTYYREVLNFDIQSNGLYSALPFLGLWLIMNIVPAIADWLRSSRIMSTIHTRKLFNTIGLAGPAAFLIGLSFIDCTQTGLAVAVMVLAVTVSGFVFSGYLVNHMDIAPQYAGTLMGLANGLAASAGFIAPYVAAVVTKDQTRESWRIVFFIAAGVYVFGAIMYCVLASADIQPWAKDQTILMDIMDIPLNGDAIYKPKTASNGHLATDPMLNGDSKHKVNSSLNRDLSSEPMLNGKESDDIPVPEIVPRTRNNVHTDKF